MDEIYFGRGVQILGPYQPSEVVGVSEMAWQQRFDAIGEQVRMPVYRAEAPDMETAKQRIWAAQDKDAARKLRA